jgi:hypothetical protein
MNKLILAGAIALASFAASAQQRWSGLPPSPVAAPKPPPVTAPEPPPEASPPVQFHRSASCEAALADPSAAFRYVQQRWTQMDLARMASGRRRTGISIELGSEAEWILDNCRRTTMTLDQIADMAFGLEGARMSIGGF